MSDSKDSKFFFKTAGVCAILIMAIPIVCAIFSAFFPVPWPKVGFLCMLIGAAIVCALAIGFIIEIVNQK